MTIKTVFKNHLPNSKYTLKNGKDAVFLNGEYITDIQSEIDELNHEIEAGNGYIYKDDNKLTVDTSDPIEEIKRKAREEALAQLRAEQAEALDKSRTTESDQNFKLNVANSDNIGAASADSISMDAPLLPTTGTATVASSAPQASTASTMDSKLAQLKANREAATKQ